MRLFTRYTTFFVATPLILLAFGLTTGCEKEEEEEDSPGVYTNEVINISNLNSEYDDYNSSVTSVEGAYEIIFSTNRAGTPGTLFGFAGGTFNFSYDKCEKFFDFNSQLSGNPFVSHLAAETSTSGNDYGPFRIVCRNDGREYTVITTDQPGDNRSLYFYRYLPWFGSALPEIGDNLPVSVINTGFNDSYLNIDHTQTRVFFSSDRDGQLDIYYMEKSQDASLADWFTQTPVTPVKIDSINSPYNDVAPMVLKDVIVFASDRPGGMGGYDLYYSVFRDGAWSTAYNFGPRVNSSSNDFRPVIGSHQKFADNFLLFSSDREGGRGGYDLYFTGIKIPDPPVTLSDQ